MHIRYVTLNRHSKWSASYHFIDDVEERFISALEFKGSAQDVLILGSPSHDIETYSTAAEGLV